MTDGLLDRRRVLLAGESWVTQAHHAKGALSYTTGSYEEGGEPLIQALQQGGASVDYLPNHRAAEEFPRRSDELGQYATVILSDIGSDTLLLDRACFVEGIRSVNRLRLLAGYVEAGGSLLMVGGYMSFSGFEGKAHYALTPLADVLPVLMSPTDDRIETPEGVTPTVCLDRHPVLGGIGMNWPYFLGYNRLIAKAEAEVLLSFEDDPLLVLAQHGAGRVAAFASDCSPHWGSRDFLSWPHYGRFWTQLVAWLANPKGGP